ncbi:MAG: Gldg family protein [Lachnospiraceae bacterium]|nr:Gldg family protein [Lachnospiraceae bacterium]
MWAIFKREFKNFFQNVIGWVFIASMVFVSALYFNAYNINAGMSDILYVLVRLLMIMIFSLPVLSMRILSEEKKNKTDQLTLTAPISVGKIILGKYLAMLAVFGITVLVIGLFPILLSAYTTIDWGINGLAILGFFFYGATCIAICMFVSSFTESQVIAAIVSIITMFVIYLTAGIEYMLENTQMSVLKVIAKGVAVFDLADRYDTFLSGVLDYRCIVYFISMSAVFIFLTVQSVQKRRYTTSVKNFALSAFSMTSIVIVIAIAIVANLIMKQFPDKYMKYDLTQQKLYSLCDATKNVVSELNEELTIYVYAAQDNKDESLDRVLAVYSELSDKIKVEYKDPNKSPKFYENFTESTPSYNSLFLETKTRTKYVDYNDMYITDYSFNDDGSYNTVQQNDMEGKITSAINYINNGLTAKIYYLSGHDEIELDKGFADAITKQNYEMESISLLGNDIPQDCQLLIIMSPTSDFSEGDVEKIMAYAENGGKLLITLGLADDYRANMPNFDKLLEYYGVYSENGLVVDIQSFVSSPYYIVPDVQNNVITTGVYGKKGVWLPYAKALYQYDPDSEDVHVVPFLSSTDKSYRKNSITDVNDYAYDQNTDEAGPLNVAVTSTRTTKDGGQTVAYIVGSPYMFTDQANELTSNANLTVFTNILNQSVNNDAAAVVVPVKSLSSEQFIIKSSAGLIIFLVLLIVVPVALLVTGFIIWTKRRKK